MSEKIIYQFPINFLRIGILTVKRKLRYIHPVLCNTVIQVFIQADHLIGCPCNISLIFRIHLLLVKHTIIVKHPDNIAFVNLIFLFQVFIGCFRVKEFFPESGKYIFLSGKKAVIYRLFIFGCSCFFKMRKINNIVIDQCKIYIINRNLYLTARNIFRIEFFSVDNIGIQNTCKLLFQDLVAGNLQILINGQIQIMS